MYYVRNRGKPELVIYHQSLRSMKPINTFMFMYAHLVSNHKAESQCVCVYVSNFPFTPCRCIVDNLEIILFGKPRSLSPKNLKSTSLGKYVSSIHECSRFISPETAGRLSSPDLLRMDIHLQPLSAVCERTPVCTSSLQPSLSSLLVVCVVGEIVQVVSDGHQQPGEPPASS